MIARRPAGFTLVELLVVLAIVAVLAGLLAPNMSGSLGAVRVREAALTLAQDVRYAQMLAVERGRPVCLAIDRTRPGHQVKSVEEASDRSAGSSYAAVTEFVGLTEGVRFERVEAGESPDGHKDVLWFDPWGGWSTGRIQLTDGSRRFEVRLGRSLGVVQVVDLDNGSDPQRSEEEAFLAVPLAPGA